MKKNAVALNPNINRLLDELVEERSKLANTTKVSLIAELIMKAHRKECK